jgi:hypothetical protein
LLRVGDEVIGADHPFFGAHGRFVRQRLPGSRGCRAGIADVKPAGECYVIEMGATNIRSENFTAPVYLETNPNVPTPVTYPRVRLLQPYRLWYLAGPDAQPQPLGEGFSFVMAQPVESLGGNVVKIKNEAQPSSRSGGW